MKTPLTMTPSDAERLMAVRQCGKCTACCVLPRILGGEDMDGSILQGGKPGYEPCRHLCRSGCSRYKDRPDVCQGFYCLWRSGHIDGDERRRPDNLGLMFTMEQIGGLWAVEAWELWQGAASDYPGRGVIDGIRGRGITVAIRYYGVPASLVYEGPDHLARGRMLSDMAVSHPQDLARYLRTLVERGDLEVPDGNQYQLVSDISRLERGESVETYYHR